jgi:nucleoside-diphosphate-sugar epimerase
VTGNVEELEDLLSSPTPADCDAIAGLEGDLMVLGVAGKMGPSLAVRARRAADRAGVRKRIAGVARFTDPAVRAGLERCGVETIAADLLDRNAVRALPDAPNIIYLAGRKFGTRGREDLTWAMNVLAPDVVAERYGNSRIVALSSGNVYPFRRVAEGGATEETPPNPVGEYAQSVLARERVFDYHSRLRNTPVLMVRLNYALDLRYGVLLDIARRVCNREPVDLAMGYVNVIWQGDANSVILRAFGLCACPLAILNLTGPETLSVRQIAERFAAFFGVTPVFRGAEGETALLNDAGKCHKLFGCPTVGVDRLIEWTADWIRAGNPDLGKPTHFEATDGRY